MRIPVRINLKLYPYWAKNLRVTARNILSKSPGYIREREIVALKGHAREIIRTAELNEQEAGDALWGVGQWQHEPEAASQLRALKELVR